MSSLSSSSLSSGKTLQGPELSEVFIKKPRTLSQTCPVETTTERLPLIQGKPRKKKDPRKNRESVSSSGEPWLKPGISLPKLQRKELPRFSRSAREDASEPVRSSDYNSVTLIKGDGLGSNVPIRSSLSKSLKCFKDVQEAEEENIGATIESSEVVGPSSCDLVFRVPSSELNFDEYKQKEKPLEESQALKRWEYWLKEHKKLQNYLSKRLDRMKCDLQFQKAENYRKLLEEKSLFVRAQIPAADKWRGHPFYWKPNIKLGNNKTPADGDSVAEYYGVKTKADKGELPDMEYIGIPTSIKKEKSLICAEDVSMYTQLNIIHGEDRLKNLREQTKALKPHYIEMKELEIIGHKIPKTKEVKDPQPASLENLPKIIVTSAQNEDSCPFDYYGNASSVFWLSIGGEELHYELSDEYCQRIKKNKFDLKWEINFGSNPIGTLIERTLRIENKGTTAVHYKFHRPQPQKTQNLRPLQPINHEPWFFFNKNPGIFLPGQTYNFKFYHRTQKPGIRTETWHLSTDPPLPKHNTNATITLWAVSTDDSSDFDIQALDSYLRRQSTRSIAAFIIEILITKALNPWEKLTGIEYRSLFCEEELFEFQNPKRYHNSVGVGELKKLFEQIPQKNQPEWDLSLTSLIQLTTKYLTGRERNLHHRQIAATGRKLFRPKRLHIANVKKHRMTYQILCKMVNGIEEECDYLKSCLLQKREERRKSEEFGEIEEDLSGSLDVEEMNGESCLEWEIKPIDFLYFQTMFYMMVYFRVSNAIENIAGVLDTSKFLEPCKKIDYNRTKPTRTSRT